MDFRIKLENFEGPLDLLLFFIRRDQINIYDIPIARITDEFINYIDFMKEIKVEVAGEFILMAALLLRIKAKMLLPQSIIENSPNAEDPRTDLVQQILEYKKFKEAAESMDNLYVNHSYSYNKGQVMQYENSTNEITDYCSNLSVYDLISAFYEVVKNLPESNPYELDHEEILLADQMDFIRYLLQESSRIEFTEITARLNTKIKIIVTFLALLELLKNHEILVKQPKPFSKLIIIKR